MYISLIVAYMMLYNLKANICERLWIAYLTSTAAIWILEVD
jgi:hypothetical protein